MKTELQLIETGPPDVTVFWGSLLAIGQAFSSAHVCPIGMGVRAGGDVYSGSGITALFCENTIHQRAPSRIST